MGDTRNPVLLRRNLRPAERAYERYQCWPFLGFCSTGENDLSSAHPFDRASGSDAEFALRGSADSPRRFRARIKLGLSFVKRRLRRWHLEAVVGALIGPTSRHEGFGDARLTTNRLTH
jgi:hypothetical protein